MFTKHPLVSILLGLTISASPATILAETSTNSECQPASPADRFHTPEWVKLRRAEMDALHQQFVAERGPMIDRQMPQRPSYQPPEVPDWVAERRAQPPVTQQMPDFQAHKVPDWVIENRRRTPTTPQPRPVFETPEWVTKHRGQNAAMQQMPAFERPARPDWAGMDRHAYRHAPTPPNHQRPDLPEWVKERRAQMPAAPHRPGGRWQPGISPNAMPKAPHAGIPAYTTPTWGAPAPYYGHPYRNHGWGGSDWGPFDGMGDMFGDMNFSMRMRSSGGGYGDGRSYTGYGAAPYAWPTPPAPVVTTPDIEPPAVETAAPVDVVAAPEQTPMVDETIADTDSDADGVVDIADICPDSASGAVVDGLGCEQSVSIVLRGVNFKTDSDQLTDTSTEILDRVANTLIANPTVAVEIAGHTDSDADEAYNKDLSQRRAETVMAYLTDKGVVADNLTAMGYGEEQPVASNETAEGKAQNRRVELIRRN